MNNFITERAEKYADFFSIENTENLLNEQIRNFNISPEKAAKLAEFNIEWHFIPSHEVLPFDEKYARKMYPTATRNFFRSRIHGASIFQHLSHGHRRHQGYVVGIETTQKPKYLADGRQFYGTQFGHDPSADPLAEYMGIVGITNGMRYDHTYPVLKRFFETINEDWKRKGLLPEGYRVTVCPPAVFNLIGTIFHPEWSYTESLEIDFYRDERGNATVFAVGANAPNDFSFIHVVEGEDEVQQTGFRVALMPEETRHDAPKT